MNEIATVSNFLSVDSALLTNIPQQLLQSIAVQAANYESLKSQKLLDEVSYEQNVSSNQNKLKAIRQQLDNALSETQQLRAKLSETQTTKTSLEQQLNEMKFSSTSTSTEITDLQSKIDKVTKEKLSLLDTINKKTNDIKELQAEKEQLRKNNTESRKMLIQLETQVEHYRSTQISTKMKEQNLSQEIELLKKNEKWLENELSKKTEEIGKFRQEKLSLISSLQSDLSNLQSSYQILTKSNDALKTRYEETVKQLDDTLIKVKELQDTQKVNEEAFRVEMSSQKRLTELWEKSSNDAKKRINDLEALLENQRKNEALESQRWKNEAQKEKSRADKLAAQIASLEGQLETTFVQGDVSSSNISLGGIPKTPLNKSTPAQNTPGSVVFSPSAKIISEIQNNGGSLVQLYSDFHKMKVRYERERFKNKNLREQLNAVVQEVENGAPTFIAEIEERKRLETDLTELSIQLESTMKENEKLSLQVKTSEIKLNDDKQEISLLNKHVQDLSRQVQHLLIQNEMISQSSKPLSAEEYETLQKLLRGDGSPKDTDTDKLITERLVLFKNTIDLQKQNSNLLKITRQLGEKMEQEERETQKKLNDVESTAVSEAKEAIKSLQSEISSLNTKLGAIQRERDMFRRMLSNKSENGMALPDAENSVESVSVTQTQQLIKQNDSLSSRVKDLESELKTYRVESEETIKSLDQKVVTLTNERSNIQIQLSKAESQVQLSDERQKRLNSTIDMLRSENEDFKVRARSLQESLSRQESALQKMSEELQSSNSSVLTLKNEISNLKAEKSIWKSIEERLNKENASLIEEKGRLSALLANAQSSQAERSASHTETIQRLNNQISNLEEETSSLRKKLDLKLEEIKTISDRKDVDSKEYQDRIAKLSTELSTSRQALLSSKTEYQKLLHTNNRLQTDLASANEKIKSLESTANQSEAGARIFALEQEVSTLKNALETSKTELSDAKKNAESLKSVAEAAETALEQMNASHDQYKASTDKQLADKEVCIFQLNMKLSITNTIFIFFRMLF